MAEPNDSFRILSVDGGGMRGLIPALVIADLERAAAGRGRARRPGRGLLPPVRRHVDRRAGRSEPHGAVTPGRAGSTTVQRLGPRRALTDRRAGRSSTSASGGSSGRYEASSGPSTARGRSEDAVTRTVGGRGEARRCPAGPGGGRVRHDRARAVLLQAVAARSRMRRANRPIDRPRLATSTTPTYFPSHQVARRGALVDGSVLRRERHDRRRSSKR